MVCLCVREVCACVCVSASRCGVCARVCVCVCEVGVSLCKSVCGCDVCARACVCVSGVCVERRTFCDDGELERLRHVVFSQDLQVVEIHVSMETRHWQRWGP